MASSPPLKCLRGTVVVSQAAAETLGTTTTVKVACAVYPSLIGIKPELWYLRTNGEWVEITRAGSGPGIYEHPMALNYDGAMQEAARANQIGIKQWVVENFQQWANDNMFAFFKNLVAKTTTPGAPSTAPITADTLNDAINAALDDMFIFTDTNADGIPEFHGK